MSRVWNFFPGPSILPEEVLKRAQSEMLGYKDSGLPPIELSHRGKYFDEIIFHAEDLLREILGIPQNYKVVYAMGGGTGAFSMIPMNLLKNGKFDYIDTGIWPQKALAEAERYGDAKFIASGEKDQYHKLPRVTPDMVRTDADYVYICGNNTDHGTNFHGENMPQTGGIPLVSDMTSVIASEKINISDYGLVFAGAQKNLGCTGLTVTIIREDLVQDTPDWVPIMYKYKTYTDNQNMYNTPPTYSIYIHMLLLEWIKEHGGLDAMIRETHRKSDLLYDYVDHSKVWKCYVPGEDRSPTNVVFNAPEKAYDEKFVQAAAEAGLVGISGYRLGGCRVSLYNAMPYEGVEALVDFMQKYEISHPL